jgi:parallel beta-helix repeat protein
MFTGNTIIGPIRLGIVVTYTSNAVIANNSVTNIALDPNNEHPWMDKWEPSMIVHHSHDNLFLNNSITNSKTGILLNASSNNTFSGNKVATNGYGLALFYSSDGNSIENNELSKNRVNIMLHNTRRNDINRNNIVHPNMRSAYDNSEENIWSDNYWSHYTGTDQNGDQIGDTPLLVPPKGSDPRPRMYPNEITTITVPPLTFVTRPDNIGVEPMYITEDTVWQNQSLTLDQKYIIVENDASLTLKDMTLTFASDSQDGIWVTQGATLHIERSTLKSDGPDHHTNIWIEQGAKFIMRDSELHNAGNWWGGGGLVIKGNGAIIENNYIAEAFFGITIDDSTGHRITGNTVTECINGIGTPDDKAGTTIRDNYISHCIVGCIDNEYLRFNNTYDCAPIEYVYSGILPGGKSGDGGGGGG